MRPRRSRAARNRLEEHAWCRFVHNPVSFAPGVRTKRSVSFVDVAAAVGNAHLRATATALAEERQRNRSDSG
ncbi:hypothetical protein GCM10023320_12150 [Pseudonocardia adelaidensis]|uniref:Uncharacterized protein n=1 Tax=Pseudonocardia adelaidensis TaxID=648754 RepID=A0ABP9NI34_9PSEU